MTIRTTVRASQGTVPALRGALAQISTRKGGSLVCRRFKSGPYGYTQAKALVYSKYGEPSDVLSYVYALFPQISSLL